MTHLLMVVNCFFLFSFLKKTFFTLQERLQDTTQLVLCEASQCADFMQNNTNLYAVQLEQNMELFISLSL